jgi:hypothetical protein
MALVLNDRVRETSTTSGTGTLDLAGAEQVGKLLLQELQRVTQLIMQFMKKELLIGK